jgi:hypothetical protein
MQFSGWPAVSGHGPDAHSGTSGPSHERLRFSHVLNTYLCEIKYYRLGRLTQKLVLPVVKVKTCAPTLPYYVRIVCSGEVKHSPLLNT